MSGAPGAAEALASARTLLAAEDYRGVITTGSKWAFTVEPPPACSRCVTGNAWLRSLAQGIPATPAIARKVVDLLAQAAAGPVPEGYAGKRGVGAPPGLGAVDAGFPAALWDMYARTGIRPEWIVPVLYSESGLNPAATNSIGCVGINQACPFAVPTPDGYTSWTASQQLQTIVTPMYGAIIKKFGAIRSGTRAYQANFLPASLRAATSLDSVLARAGGAVYAENSGFDYQHKGTITVADLAHAISKSAGASYPRQVIASAYAQAPGGVGGPTDPVYGLDFGGGPSASTARNVAILVGIAGLGVAGFWAAREWRLRRRWAA